MIAINVSLTDNGASAALNTIISSLTGPESKGLSEAGGIGARNAAIKYHRAFDQAGGWKGRRYLGPGPSEGTSFGSQVASGWMLQSATETGATISNDAPFYSHKVTGGTIRPARAKHLTIPMIREAKGLRAAVYQRTTGKKLFKVKGKKALFEKLEGGKGIRAVYALVESVTQRPWTGAVPPEDVIGSAYVETYREALIRKIEKA